MTRKYWQAHESDLGWSVAHLERQWVVTQLAVEGCATQSIAKKLAALMNEQREIGEDEALRKYLEMR